MDATSTPPIPEQLPTTQVHLPPLEATKEPGKADVPSHKVEVAKGKEAGQGKARPKDKGKVKEAKTLQETQDLMDAPKAKDAASKAVDPPASHPANTKDPPPA